MFGVTSLDRVLCLPYPELLAVQGGLSSFILPKVHIRKDWRFLLCPVPAPDAALDHYQHSFQPIFTLFQESEALLSHQLSHWAICKGCQIIRLDQDLVPLILSLSIWNQTYLEHRLENTGSFILVHLEVYPLQTAIPLEVEHYRKLSTKLGKFSSLKQLEIKLEQVQPSETPITSEIATERRRTAIAQIFGEQSESWIDTITILGDRSIEEETGKKSHYQAGTDFENVTRRSLEFLGFTIEEAYRGGAGGLDFYCSHPFPLVGECKSGSKIPSDTTEQLIKLGGMKLEPEDFKVAAKLIIGPGKPTPDVIQASEKWKVSIMKPETLQQLAELQAQYPGAIDLFKLKEHLKAGQIDEEIQTFIDRIKQDIAIRRSIIAIVKDNPDDANPSSIRIYYRTSYKPYPNLPDLTEQEIRDILIELSSPLTGYLGREPGSNGSNGSNGNDRFYFRKDL